MSALLSPVQTPAQHPPAGCSGDCDAGQRDCTCARAVIGMWDDERAHPVRTAALVGTAIGIALLASHLWPWGFAA